MLFLIWSPDNWCRTWFIIFAFPVKDCIFQDLYPLLPNLEQIAEAEKENREIIFFKRDIVDNPVSDFIIQFGLFVLAKSIIIQCWNAISFHPSFFFFFFFNMEKYINMGPSMRKSFSPDLSYDDARGKKIYIKMFKLKCYVFKFNLEDLFILLNSFQNLTHTYNI